MTVLGFDAQDALMLRNLVWARARERYIGSLLGWTWLAIQPILAFGVYILVFTFVFRVRVESAPSTFGYVTWLICGLVPYQMMADSLTSAASVVTGSANLVKNVVFKTELLPIAATVTSGIPFLVGLVIITILRVVDGDLPGVSAVWLVLVFLCQCLLAGGLALFLGATCVFIRDLILLLPLMLNIMMFATPVMYPIDMLPTWAQDLMMLNPMYHVVEPYRATLLQDRAPSLLGVGYLLAISALVFLLGLWYFRRLKGFFEAAL